MPSTLIKMSYYEQLFKKDGSVSVHYKNIQTLATEMLIKNIKGFF